MSLSIPILLLTKAVMATLLELAEGCDSSNGCCIFWIEQLPLSQSAAANIA